MQSLEIRGQIRVMGESSRGLFGYYVHIPEKGFSESAMTMQWKKDNVWHKEDERSRRVRPYDAVEKKHRLSLVLRQPTPGARNALSQGVSWVTDRCVRRFVATCVRPSPHQTSATIKHDPGES